MSRRNIKDKKQGPGDSSLKKYCDRMKEPFIPIVEQKVEKAWKWVLAGYGFFVILPCSCEIVNTDNSREWNHLLIIFGAMTAMYFVIMAVIKIRNYLACRRREMLEFEGEKIIGRVKRIKAHRGMRGKGIIDYSIYVEYEDEGKTKIWKSPRYTSIPNAVVKEGHECLLLKKGRAMCLDKDQRLILNPENGNAGYKLTNRFNPEFQSLYDPDTMAEDEEDDEIFYMEMEQTLRDAGESEEKIKQFIDEMRETDCGYNEKMADIDSIRTGESYRKKWWALSAETMVVIGLGVGFLCFMLIMWIADDFRYHFNGAGIKIGLIIFLVVFNTFWFIMSVRENRKKNKRE